MAFWCFFFVCKHIALLRLIVVVSKNALSRYCFWYTTQNIQEWHCMVLSCKLLNGWCAGVQRLRDCNATKFPRLKPSLAKCCSFTGRSRCFQKLAAHVTQRHRRYLLVTYGMLVQHRVFTGGNTQYALQSQHYPGWVIKLPLWNACMCTLKIFLWHALRCLLANLTQPQHWQLPRYSQSHNYLHVWTVAIWNFNRTIRVGAILF